MGYRRADLWERYRRTRDVALRNALVEKYLHIARNVVQAMLRRLPRSIGAEELLSDAVLGLVRAVENFDPATRTRFVTYASYRIRGAVLDELRVRDWVPRLARHKARVAGTEDELRRMIPLSVAEQGFRRAAPEEGGQLEYEDERARLPFLRLEAGDLCARLLTVLRPRERAAFVFYYSEDRPMKEIGAILGISESRVSQLLKAAAAKMRRAATAAEAASAAAITGA